MALVVVISSHVARGFIGNAAAVLALNRLGHEAWALPSVTMAHHPGHGPVTMLRTGADDLAVMLNELGDATRLAGVGAVLSGYLAAPGQVRAVARFVAAVKAANPAALYCCDPVIGDDGALYVPDDVAAAIRDRLVPLADLVTPNRFELGWLAGADATEAHQARALGAGSVLVTSCTAMLRQGIATMLVGKRGGWMAETRRLADVPHGAGDLAAALLLGHLLNGLPAQEALERTVAGVFDVLVRSLATGRDELDLVGAQEALTRPRAMVRLRMMPS